MTTAATRQRVRESFSRLPGHLIRRVHQVATAYFAEECGADLTAVQYAALVAIGAHPGIDATRLSEIIFFDRSTIGDVLDRMEGKGWILRYSTPSDRRIKRLEALTRRPGGPASGGAGHSPRAGPAARAADRCRGEDADTAAGESGRRAARTTVATTDATPRVVDVQAFIDASRYRRCRSGCCSSASSSSPSTVSTRRSSGSSPRRFARNGGSPSRSSDRCSPPDSSG